MIVPSVEWVEGIGNTTVRLCLDSETCIPGQRTRLSTKRRDSAQIKALQNVVRACARCGLGFSPSLMSVVVVLTLL